MKKIIIAAAAILMAACGKAEKALPEHKKNNYICIDLTITKIEKTYFITPENENSYYYTVYAMDEKNNIYCICDDMEKDCISGYEYLLILGNECRLIYEKGKPDCTGEIIPIE